MAVIYEEDEYYVCYSVNVDKERLKNIKKSLIENCSEIKHFKYKTIMLPNKSDLEHIRNYKEKSLGGEEYLVEYDYYEHPFFVMLIDCLINDNISALEEINEYTINEEDSFLNVEIKEFIKGLNGINLEKYSKLINKLESITDKDKKRNINLLIYKEIVADSVSFEEINRIEKSKVLEVQNFFGTGETLAFESEIKRHTKQKLI